MAYSTPSTYSRAYSFNGYSTSNPTDPQIGSNIDNEMDDIAAAFNKTVNNLIEIQRSDGKLANLSVHNNAFDQSALQLIANKFTARGAWAATTAYAIGDMVSFGGNTYVTLEAHTSSASFTTDSAKWLVLANGDVSTDAATVEYLSGDGSTKSFTTATSYMSANNVQIFVEGDLTRPLYDYTLSGTALAFTATYTAPASGTNNIVLWGVSSTVASILSSATAAAASEAAAAASATAAATSATNAASSETAAATSATASASSATASAGSSTTSATEAANAATSATNSATSATASAASATAAASDAALATASEAAAGVSATAASGSASSASTSATNAATSATNAATSETSAAASLDEFTDLYLGTKSSNPSLDNDGDPLVQGALHYNSTDGVMKVYNGSTWLALSVDTDVKASVSANDTNPSYLFTKIEAGDAVTITETNDGSDERVRISSDAIAMSIALG